MAGNGGLGVLEREHADIEELFEKVSDPDANRRKVLQEILKRPSSPLSMTSFDVEIRGPACQSGAGAVNVCR